jgi:hypothetical protein
LYLIDPADEGFHWAGVIHALPLMLSGADWTRATTLLASRVYYSSKMKPFDGCRNNANAASDFIFMGCGSSDRIGQEPRGL